MPGLLRGIARTAVIAGTASAVNGRVQRHQAEKFADRDAQIYAQQQQAYAQQTQPVSGTDDTVAQLEKLGELKDRGILSDEEFAAAKAKILAS